MKTLQVIAEFMDPLARLYRKADVKPEAIAVSAAQFNALCDLNPADRNQSIVDTSEAAFVVMVLGYWGRGATIKEAAFKCKSQGASVNERAIIRLILGDDKPEVNGSGSMLREQGSVNVIIGNGFKLGALLKLEGD